MLILLFVLAELGLGLAEEAAENFNRALQLNDSICKPIAAYGFAFALLVLAQRDAEDGKFGAAKVFILRAVEGFETLTSAFGCAQKLLGDIFSFGAALPPSVFEDPSGGAETISQISFVKKGEACYKAAVEYFTSVSDTADELSFLQAALITDAGANLLLCAQLTAFQQGDGLVSDSANTSKQNVNVSKWNERALVEFSRAIELCPDYAPAWCGIGCSAVLSDPLLAQHAFCRSLQLDSLFPDPYSNLGFLYTSHQSFAASQGVLEALTQVSDSPMNWINRALIFERNAATMIDSREEEKAETDISKAADAYRAAIQIVKHPSALLGLAMACRGSRNSSPFTAAIAWQESCGFMQQYKGKMGSSDISALLLQGIIDLERRGNDSSVKSDALKEGNKSVTAMARKLGLLQQHSEVNGKTMMDATLIQKCLSSAEGSAWEEEEPVTTSSFPTTSLARQIVHEPDKGELWVKMAKSLLRERGKTKASLDSAVVASERAVKILTDQLTFPNQQGGSTGKHGVVNNTDLSEALSLDYWLDDLLMEKKAPNDGGTSSKALQLQKALMICPGNAFAREVFTDRAEQGQQLLNRNSFNR